MKCFAREGERVFVEMTVDEWAQIDGFRSDYRRRNDGLRTIQAGDVLDVGPWHDAATTVVDNIDRIERLRDTLKQEVERLDQQLAAIGPPRLET